MALYFDLEKKSGMPVEDVFADTMELTLEDNTEIRLEWENSEYVNNDNRRRRCVKCTNVTVCFADGTEIYINSPEAEKLDIVNKICKAKLTYMCGFDNETDDSYNLLDEYRITNNELTFDFHTETVAKLKCNEQE